MRALAIERTGGPGELRLLELPVPELTQPDDVRIRVRAAALNHLDLFVVEGLRGLQYAFPHVVGSDGAGVVEAVGGAAGDWRTGDEVLVNPGVACRDCEWCRAGEEPLCPRFGIVGEHRPGAAAEFLVVPARNLARKPAGLGWAEAAAFPLATLTAWRMLVRRARLAPGEVVLVRGIGGGVAQAAARIVHHLGGRAIATSTSEAKLARARELFGVEVVPAGADVPAEVRRLTGGRGADVVVDSVGEATWESSLRSLARGGRLVTCGGTSGPMVTIDVRRLFWYQWSFLGSTMGSAAEFAEVARLAAEPALRPVVDATFPLADGAAAFRRLAAGTQFGKVVLEVTP
jgi:NADPH:quinone reductase-like Zn-dependent oxidoreductase